MRLRNSILTLMFGVLTAVGAIPQEATAPPDSVDKYRRCDLQVRMYEGYCFPSMIDLIANPELFDGKKVMIVGYVHFAFEGDAIYLHEEDFLYGISPNSLRLSLSSATPPKKLMACQDSYALMRGTFKADSWDYGELHDIANCTAIEKRRK